MNRLIQGLLLLLAFCAALPVQAAIYLVSKAGPYFDISSALGAAMSPGDIVRISDNSSYTEQLIFMYPSVTVEAAPGCYPSLYPVGSGSAVDFNAPAGVLRGLKIVHTAPGYTSSVYDMYGNAAIRDCVIDDSQDGTVTMAVQVVGLGKTLVSNCRITGPYSVGIQFGFGTVTNRVLNTVVSNCATGIQGQGADGMRIVKCRVVGSTLDGIRLDSCTGCVLLFYNFVSSGGPRNVAITNDMSSFFICNNTFINNNDGLSFLWPLNAGSQPPRVVANNILWGNATDLYVHPGIAGNLVVFQNDVAGSVNAPTINQAGLINLDPKLGNNAALQATSPCIDAGIPFNFPAFGYSFPIYGAGRDIGCRESNFGGKSFSPADFTNEAEIVVTEPNLEPGKTCNILIKNLMFPGSAGESAFTNDIHPVPVIVRIVSLRGEIVRTLFRGIVDQNLLGVSWDGKDDSGEYVTPGIYFIRVSSNTYNASRRISFIR